jgi:hypoxanthine phosphoribosyltransferase
VACSGGPDSSTLLDVLQALSPELGVSLSVACVDHRLRQESLAEAEAVQAHARALGLDGAILPVSIDGRGMAAARHARYQALVEHAQRRSATAIAVAHTATDQTETLLDRLVRGSGIRGLAAMARVRPIADGLRLIRPLLDVTAAEVEAYVAARGLEVARDPTNRNLAYRRSRLRHEVLPLLRRERADIDRALAELADRLRADADALDAQAEQEATRIQHEDGLDVPALARLPDALFARVVARAAGTPLEAVHIAALRKLCEGVSGTRESHLPGGRVAERRYDRLRFGAPSIDPGDVELLVTAPGRYTFLRVEVEVAQEAFARLGPGLVLRNFRAGDQLGSRKLKEWFIDRKVPRPERRFVPLLVRRSPEGEKVLCALTGEARVQ